MCLCSGYCTGRNFHGDAQNRDIFKLIYNSYAEVGSFWLTGSDLKRNYKYRQHITMTGCRDTDGHNYYLFRIFWKNVRQMCFEFPFYYVSNTSVSFPIFRKYECLRAHRSPPVRQMCSETNELLQSAMACWYAHWWIHDGTIVKTNERETTIYDGETTIVQWWNNECTMMRTWWYDGENTMVQW
jgi:hypothetical protein